MPRIFAPKREGAFPVGPKARAELERARPKRILVLGSDGHGRGVSSYRWDMTPRDLNVADYDVVVLNFAAFAESKTLAEGLPTDRLPSVESMARLLFSPNAEIIAVGSPATLIGPPPEPSRSYYDNRYRADYWLPMFINTEADAGTQFGVDANEWAGYFEHVSGWTWIATGDAPFKYQTAGDYLNPVTNRADNLLVMFEPIATTRYEKLIALRVHLTAVRHTQYLNRWDSIAEPDPASREVVANASPVFWLPAPDRVSVEEAIDGILRERYGIAQEARVAEWASEYSLPAERPIAEEVAELEGQRRELERRLSEARGRAVEAARPRLLLYEKGKEILEPVVRDTLRQLGARVEDPEVEGVEDGRVFREEGRAVLEIEGRVGPIKQDDVRQVVQWASEAKLEDGGDYKALILGNPHCETPPGERGEPLARTRRRTPATATSRW